MIFHLRLVMSFKTKNGEHRLKRAIKGFNLQPFDPKIDRTFHRLVRHSVHPDHFEHFVHFVHSEHSVAGDSEHSDFEHSAANFHTENMAQPP